MVGLEDPVVGLNVGGLAVGFSDGELSDLT